MKGLPLSPVTILGDDHALASADNTKRAAHIDNNDDDTRADDDGAAPYVESQSPRPPGWLPRVRESVVPQRASSRLSGLPRTTTTTTGARTTPPPPSQQPLSTTTTPIAPAHPYTTPPTRSTSISGALQPGGPVNLWSRENVGLLVNYFVVGIFNGVLPGLVYPFFKIYLGLEGYQSNATDTLLMFAWYFKFVFGIISDCLPICGYRRKPYIIGGWCCVVVIMTVMALEPVVAPHRRYKGGPVVNDAAAADSPKYVIPLMLVTIGYLFADVSCDGLMVEFAQREFEHMRGRAQLTVYGVRFLGELSGTLLVALGLNSPLYNGRFKFALRVNDVFWILAGAALVAVGATVFHLRDERVAKGQSLTLQLRTFWTIMQQRATWQIVLYGFLQKLCFAFDVSPASAINQHWLHADPFTKNLFRAATTGVYAAGSFVTHKYLLNVSWRATMVVAIVAGAVVGLPSVLVTVFDVYRDLLFYLAKDQVVSFFDCLAMMVRILVIVEIAEPGFESSTYGLVTTVYNLAGPSAIALSNYIGSAFDVYDADIVADTTHVRWHVAACFLIMYGVRVVLNLAVLPLLPKQKPAARALKRHGGTHTRVAALLFSFFAVVFVFAITVNLMSIFEATACLKLVGGEGCGRKGS